MTGDKHQDIPFFVGDDLEEDDDEDVFSSVGVTPSLPPHGVVPLGHAEAPRASVSGAFPSVSGAFPSVRMRAPETLRAKLALLTPDNQILREVEVHGTRFILGRQGSDLALDDEFVSRWHAQLSLAPSGALMLEDLDSPNGVFLRIADEFMLEDQDELVIGAQRFIFRHHSPTPKLFEPMAPTRHATPRHLGSPMPRAFPHLIHVIEDGHIGGLYPMPDKLHIGQARGEITCPADSWMAPLHAFIERRHDKYYIHDAGSDYGTYVRVHGALELLQGDCFLLGRTRLTLLRVG